MAQTREANFAFSGDFEDGPELDDEPELPIVTSYVFPPIPIRAFDWSAVREGYEPGDPIGWGKTELAAKLDLLEREAELEPISHREADELGCKGV